MPTIANIESLRDDTYAAYREASRERTAAAYQITGWAILSHQKYHGCLGAGFEALVQEYEEARARLEALDLQLTRLNAMLRA
jgi:hypothetical protein